MIHRVDPLVHTSRKGIIKTAVEKKKIQEEKQLSSRRKAPAIKISNGKCQSKARRRTRNRAELNLNPIRHVKFIASTAKPKQELIE